MRRSVWSLVKLPVGMRTVLVHVMKGRLRQATAFESVSPVCAFDAAIQHAIPRSHLHFDRPIRPIEPKRPKQIAPQTQCHTDFTRNPVSVLWQNVPVLAHAKIGISRV